MALTNRNVPVFIVSFNRLGYLSTLMEALERYKFENITIIDNASTYEPLLAYLEKTPHRVERLPENLGHLALWRSGRFGKIIDQQRFILTDCDVVPARGCPEPITEHLEEMLDRYPSHTKAGLSLKIDDLPNCYAFKDQVLEWEKPFWEHRLEDGNYEAAIDTTFALYRPGISCEQPNWWRSIRVAPPYSALHLPWYQDTSMLSDEDRYYQSKVAGISSQWSITDPVLLKSQNTELQHQIAALKAEIELLKRGGGSWHRKPGPEFIKGGLAKLGLLPLARRVRSYLEIK